MTLFAIGFGVVLAVVLSIAHQARLMREERWREEIEERLYQLERERKVIQGNIPPNVYPLKRSEG